MSSYPISEMFGELHESSALGEAYVEEVHLDRSRNTMSIVLRLKTEQPNGIIDEFAEAVRRTYGLNGVTCRLAGGDTCTRSAAEEFLRIAAEVPSVRALFAGCELSEENGVLNIRLAHGGAAYAEHWRQSAERELEARLGRRVAIHITDGGDECVQSLVEKVELRSREIMDEQRKTVKKRAVAKKEQKRTFFG